ncbi:MAG: hypothetical protein SGILL_009116 [Bacillariaceae sp.]
MTKSGLDLSGTWKPIVTYDFLEAYDNFLKACGESYWMRKLLVNAVSMQTQQVRQYGQGKRLEIVDIHPMARWNRTIVASGMNLSPLHQRYGYEEYVNTMIDPQGNEMVITAHWCNNGTVHKSALKTSKRRLQDAWLETNRFLTKVASSTEDDVEPETGLNAVSSDSQSSEYILVCESIFHPPPASASNENGNLRPASIVWKYERV